MRLVGQGDEITAGQIPFTPRAKKVLELALREAKSLGHNYIGTEHILLGLVRENEGVAARVLYDFGADAERIRGEVIRMLSGPGERLGQCVTTPRSNSFGWRKKPRSRNTTSSVLRLSGTRSGGFFATAHRNRAACRQYAVERSRPIRVASPAPGPCGRRC